MRTRCAIPFLLLLAVPAAAQSHRQWVVGGHTVLAPAGADRVQVTGVEARVRILDRAATTTLQIELGNPCGRPLEAVLLLPVPDGAAISGFTFEGPGREATAEVLPRDEARRLYDEITARLRDPALLEFAGWRCLRSSVFPVPAHGRQRLRLTYDHVLDADGARVDYVLPRSEALALAVPWDVRIELSTAAPLGLCYSPSHAFEFERRGANAMVARLSTKDRCEPGSLRLGFTTTADPARPGALLFAYPDPTVGGGYFLLLAGVPAPKRDAVLRREVTIVLDRSGSMAGRKLEQAKAAARQVLLALGDGEGIQIIDYGNTVSAAFPAPVAKNARTTAAALAYLDAVRPHGGTNLHDALVEALRAEPVPQTLPFVLFLTDGLPTVGPRREADLRLVAETGNPHGRRVFCFGVGNDVNVPLLDRIAETTRATTIYVTPEEDVERAVARTFARLDEPVLAGPTLRTASATPRIAEVLPPVLPDLFAGDQLVVLGQYRGEDDLEFELGGRGADGATRFRFTLPVRTATTRHAFVPRLWASRQIAFLVDELRQAAGEGPTGIGALDPFAAPRLGELRDEILRLSARFGVLGEYTAFLAREGSDLGDWHALATACANVLTDRAVRTRSGAAAVNQGCNLWQQKTQAQANYRNVYLDAELQPVETTTVQQICDRAFFRRGDRWIDGNSVANGKVAPDERVPFASPRFFEVVRRLEREGRAGLLSLRGEILLELDGRNLLVTPGAPEPQVHR